MNSKNIKKYQFKNGHKANTDSSVLGKLNKNTFCYDKLNVFYKFIKTNEKKQFEYSNQSQCYFNKLSTTLYRTYCMII